MRLALTIVAALILLVSNQAADAAPRSKTNSASLSISGYGLFGDRELKRMVKLLEKNSQRPPFFDPNFVEDAVLLFSSKLSGDGHLTPILQASMTLRDGTILTQRWTKRIDEPLPRPLEVRDLAFRVFPGPLFYYDKLEFEGLTQLSKEDAIHYFMETEALLPLKKAKVYSPERLRRSVSSLLEVLERAGFESARNVTNYVQQDDKTGAVQVKVVLDEGHKSIVRSVRRDVYYDGASEPSESLIFHPMAPYSRLWLQDLIQSFKSTFYYFGYADTKLETSQSMRQDMGDHIEIDLLAKVFTGPIVKVGEVNFSGIKSSNEKMLRNRTKLHEGDPLNPILVERARYRLARLGSFDSIDVAYDNIDSETRDVLYRIKEGRQIEFSALFGYGSYELLRGGFDLDQFNVFGRAHQSHLRAVQSFKASTVDYTYTMPEFAGHNFDIVFNADWLRREEISFTREEYGGGLGARHYYAAISSDLGLRYNYQVLNALNLGTTPGLAEANVGSMIADLKHDRRDNPLFPHAGYKVFGTFEVASDYLAGNVNYQRFETSSSYHQAIGKARWLHFGFNHGFVFTMDGPALDLPFNKRFFPGGENSVRGFQQGEAAPRDSTGKVIGAESYLSGNVEFEQGLTRSLSGVIFLDSVAFAQDIKHYPADTGLYSIGVGLRFKTLIGPARLEYGHNLNPRQDDPSGTIHFSIGFPF
jgi:outer membrane protein insertion porin family